MKKRLDVLLVERALVKSRERAQAQIIAGNVLVDDVPAMKPGVLIKEDSVVRLREGAEDPYVSRGAHKLIAALNEFNVTCEGRVGLDVGASTGGFTQVLLERGAKHVHAIDVGHNQLDWKLRSDPRVRFQEKINARNLEYPQIGEKVGLIVIDVSFISLDKILPALIQFAESDGSTETDWITLIKPQFEVGRAEIGKGGIVRDEASRLKAVEEVTESARRLGLSRLGLINSPITGTDGNHEYLAHWRLRKA